MQIAALPGNTLAVLFLLRGKLAEIQRQWQLLVMNDLHSADEGNAYEHEGGQA